MENVISQFSSGLFLTQTLIFVLIAFLIFIVFKIYKKYIK